MAPPRSDDNHTVLPEHSLGARVAGGLEQICFIVLRVSFPGMILTGSACLVYVIGGGLATSLGIWSPTYQFLSLTDNLYFATLGCITGLDICAGTGSLIILALMRGVKTERRQISTLAAFIGFGFGAGIVQQTAPTVLQVVLSAVG